MEDQVEYSANQRQTDLERYDHLWKMRTVLNRARNNDSYLFLKCEYKKWIMKEGLEATGLLITLNSVNTIEEALHELNKITP